jgi:prepilin signal peptidase PulO-like enzyme (type II secretory pathway)
MSVLLFFLGISIGSFLNVLIDRLSVGQDVVHGRSHCDYCHKTLHWYELIPIFSWIIQGGKSRCCHKKLSWQYPLIECITGIGFVYIFSVYSIISFVLFAYLLIFSSAVVLFVADLKYEILPTPLLLSAAIGIVLYRLFEIIPCFSLQCSVFFWSTLFPSFVAATFFFFLWAAFRGRAMGDGDIYLVFLIGLFIGYPKILIALYIAFLTGAVVGVILILGRKKGLQSHISFGPFLIFGTVMSILFSSQILSVWFHLQGL